jgi:hypothetical protein
MVALDFSALVGQRLLHIIEVLVVILVDLLACSIFRGAQAPLLDLRNRFFFLICDWGTDSHDHWRTLEFF